MITPLWKFNVALLWSVLGLPLGCVCIWSACGSLARALAGPNVGMDYAPFVVLGGWAAVLCGLAALATPRPAAPADEAAHGRSLLGDLEAAQR